ncbi:MAG: hypothetical protein U9R51_03255, partial [Actinomycetota bacterium]|nr:hypothetical protein [Actinomycetota bacterium]
MSEKTVREYDILFHWSRLEWLFEDDHSEREFMDGEFWKGAMAAGFKTDRDGDFYLSVPRWAPGIPATMNKIVMVEGRPLIEPYPSREMNEIGMEDALQS